MILKVFNKISQMALIAIFLGATGCSSIGNVLNPFYEPPTADALLGEKNSNALNGGQQKAVAAREALVNMASYRRAQDPQPVDPIVQPAVVRLMWVPDHLNKNGDLVPQHFYYLKVLKDRWAVTDAFELESQLGSKIDSSNVPYVQQGDFASNNN